MIRVHVGGAVRVPRNAMTEAEIETDWQALSCPNPARIAAERREDRNAHRLPERVSSLIITDTAVCYPIAAANIYKARLRNIAHEIVDERPTFEARPLPFLGTLRPLQEQAVDRLLQTSVGIVEAPPGAGKTEIACATIARLGVPAIVIVSSLDLARQWVDRVLARLSVTAGLIGGGERAIGFVTVALVQSLTEGCLAEIADRFGVIIVDECHRAAAPTYMLALGMLRARRRYGLSATPFREDGLFPFAEHHLGRVVHRVSLGELTDAGLLCAPTYKAVRTSFAFSYYSREDWHPLLDAIATDDARNTLIVETVARECADAAGIVLTGRVEHAVLLCEMLAARGLRAAALTGDTKKKDREAALDAARCGDLDVLVATQLADEGLDVPRLSRAFLVFPAKCERQMVQRIGRCLRVHEGKPSPVIYDFVDTPGPLKHQARERARIFSSRWSEAA